MGFRCGAGTWADGSGSWNDGGADATWNNAFTIDAVFGGGASGTGGVVALGSHITAASLTFNAPFAGIYSITTETYTLTLGTNIIANDSSALLGSLLVTVAAVIISLKREPVLVIVYAITGIYVASIASGNFSDRLFHWGEVPAAILTLAAPLLYVQLAKWIPRRDGTALPGLTAGYAGLLAGLLVMQLLRLRISGQGWVSLLYGIIIVLGLGFALGWLAVRRLIRLLDKRFHFAPGTLQYLDTGHHRPDGRDVPRRLSGTLATTF